MPPARGDDLGELVVHQAREVRGALAASPRAFPGVVSVTTCRSTPVLVEHPLPVFDVAVPLHDDVVVAGVVQQRVALGVFADRHAGPLRPERAQVRGRVVVVVEVDDRHGGSVMAGVTCRASPLPEIVDGHPDHDQEEPDQAPTAGAPDLIHGDQQRRDDEERGHQVPGQSPQLWRQSGPRLPARQLRRSPAGV